MLDFLKKFALEIETIALMMSVCGEDCVIYVMLSTRQVLSYVGAQQGIMWCNNRAADAEQCLAMQRDLVAAVNLAVCVPVVSHMELQVLSGIQTHSVWVVRHVGISRRGASHQRLSKEVRQISRRL